MLDEPMFDCNDLAIGNAVQGFGRFLQGVRDAGAGEIQECCCLGRQERGAAGYCQGPLNQLICRGWEVQGIPLLNPTVLLCVSG